MPGPEEPHGLGQSDARLHNSWYMMWWRLYVQGPRDVLRARDMVRQAKARRATLTRRLR